MTYPQAAFSDVCPADLPAAVRTNEAAFKKDPSGRRGHYKLATALRAEVLRCTFAIDEVLLLEADSFTALQDAYTEKGLDFQKP